MKVGRAAAPRLRWALAFALLLLALSSARVFADGASSNPPLPADASMLPTQAQIAQALVKVDAEEEAREEWLAGPRASAERSYSVLAYTDLSAADAEHLLASQFAETLEAIDSDPARSLSDSTLDRVLAPTVATVTEDGKTALLDSTIPVRTVDASGEKSKVDLNLQPVPGGFESENPLVPLSIPSQADEAIEIGPAGLGVTQAGAEESLGRRFEGDDVFYPEVQPDTDLLISPISAGVELSDQLRSRESPEVLGFDHNLPEGDVLQKIEGGGAEVIGAGGGQLAEVLAPHALDAQGTEAPVDLALRGSSLMIRVPHRAGEYAYPILLDPEIVENWLTPSWFSGAGLSVLTDGTWTSTSATGGVALSTNPIFHKFGGSERGLVVSIPKGKNVAGNLDGHWGYGVPKPNSFISRATLSPFKREDGSCNSCQPHDYAGLWDGSKFVQLNKNDAEKGSSQLFTSLTGRSLLFGLDSGAQPLELACNRDLYLGGIAIWLEDPDQPSLSTTPSAEWMDNVPIRQAVSATDGGLGVKRFETEAIDVANNARNPFYKDFGANNCTNYISQILLAGGAYFMRKGQAEDGAWWYENLPRGSAPHPYSESPGEVHSGTWALSNELPRHLWQYGLAVIDPAQHPQGWTVGDIIAYDWVDEDGRGNINHLDFVVGTEDLPGGREPLIANESSGTANYPAKPWQEVRERIEKAHGSVWARFALTAVHSGANWRAKVHKNAAKLYGPNGLFPGRG